MVYEISTPAKYLDGVETETFAHNGDLDTYRGMLGVGPYVQPAVLSETGAVGGRNYYYNMDYWTQLSYLQFAGGVNRIVFHGYSGIEGSRPTPVAGPRRHASDLLGPVQQPPAGRGVLSAVDRDAGPQPEGAAPGQTAPGHRDPADRQRLHLLRTSRRPTGPRRTDYFMNDKPYFWRTCVSSTPDTPTTTSHPSCSRTTRTSAGPARAAAERSRLQGRDRLPGLAGALERQEAAGDRARRPAGAVRQQHLRDPVRRGPVSGRQGGLQEPVPRRQRRGPRRGRRPAQGAPEREDESTSRRTRWRRCRTLACRAAGELRASRTTRS